MKHLYITNTDFEFELSRGHSLPLSEALEQHPVFMQLQFLPLLYGDKDDVVVVTALPDNEYLEYLSGLGFSPLPTLLVMDKDVIPKDYQIVSWGMSPEIAEWSKKQRVEFHIPDWKVTKAVNSKEFSFANSKKLPNACLLWDEQELKEWLQHPFDKVLKQCFGLSGRGNLVLVSNGNVSWDAVKSFCHKEWNHQRPVIAEPWVRRVLDFSSQWYINENGSIEYVGSVVIENDSRGAYVRTFVGDEQRIFGQYYGFLEQHRIAVQPVLKVMSEQGYFGPLGIDAMVYRDKEILVLHPIVEINARQTMSVVAIYFQRRWYPERDVSLSYAKVDSNKKGLLPESLCGSAGKRVGFTKQWVVEEGKK